MEVLPGTANRVGRRRLPDLREPRLALLVASLTEAFFLFMLMGYGPLYLHSHWHAPFLLASEGAALPSLATFAGSIAWGYLIRPLGLRRVAITGLAGYVLLGAAIWSVSTPVAYVAVVSALTLLSSALAPATLAYLIQSGGGVGARLAQRLQWQSGGWMTAGLAGGYLYGLGPRSFPFTMLVLGLLAGLALVGVARSRAATASVPPWGLGHRARIPYGALWLVVILPFFLAYAGNEGFFTNFGLYLHTLDIPPVWVGWTAAISTALGWMLAARAGRLADRVGGQRLLLAVLTGYGVTYGLMALSPWHAVSVALFSLPLYPLLTLGAQRAAAERVHGSAHGAVMGLLNGTSGLATFVGGTLLGGVETRLGPHWAPWGAAALVGLALALLLAARVAIKEAPAVGS